MGPVGLMRTVDARACARVMGSYWDVMTTSQQCASIRPSLASLNPEACRSMWEWHAPCGNPALPASSGKLLVSGGGCSRIGRVRIIDNQDETFSSVADTLPRKWRRSIFGLAGVLRGNVTILFERGVFKLIAIAAFPHRIISAVAKRTTASLAFRYQAMRFISPQNQRANG
jgi:hypothetical protein